VALLRADEKFLEELRGGTEYVLNLFEEPQERSEEF